MCLRFVRLGFTQRMVEVIGEKVYSVTKDGAREIEGKSRGQYIRHWNGDIGGHTPRRFEASGSAPHELLSDLLLTADFFVETKRRAFEEKIAMPGFPVDGKTVEKGGEYALDSLRSFKERHAAGEGASDDMVWICGNLMNIFAVSRSSGFVVWIG